MISAGLSSAGVRRRLVDALSALPGRLWPPGQRRLAQFTIGGLAAATFAGGAGLAMPDSVLAQASGPFCPAAATVSGGTATLKVTCTSTQAAQYWTVPQGLSQATFTLYGAQGGSASTGGGAGGLGAEVVATMPVTAGTTLQVNVGAVGSSEGHGGFNGGGSAVNDETGGGGGASDVRAPTDGYSSADRLLVAGGGGGGGFQGAFSTRGGSGGNAGSAGQNGQSDGALTGGVGGGAGTASGPGAGGAGGTGYSPDLPPTPGNSGSGANGGGSLVGGGGGGGYFGGGGGGQGAESDGGSFAGSGGGGGGSSYDGGFAGASITDGVSAPDDAPNGEVVITYSLPVTGLAVTTTSLPSAQIHTAYAQTLTASGGDTVYSWSLAGGSLPDGLTLNADGVISGTPTTPGTFPFTVQVSDTESPAAVATAALSITVAGAPLTVTTTSLSGAVIGSAYNQTLAASGGTTPYTWTIVPGGGFLPVGLSLNTATGVISGTPSAAETTSFTVKVTDSSSPAESATQQLSISVTAALSVTTTSLPVAVEGSPYDQTLSASGGTAPYQWSVVSGPLPSGLTLSLAGAITGQALSPGTFTFEVQVTDASNPAQTATGQLSINVLAPLAVTTTSLSGAVVGTPYSQNLAASGGTAPYE